MFTKICIGAISTKMKITNMTDEERGQAQIVEKEKKHYQGLPEDLTPTAGKVGASAAENKKIDKTERSRK